VATTEVNAQDAMRSHFCKTPDCTNQAKSEFGRYAYCTPCQIKRGTARADGSPIGNAPSTGNSHRPVATTREASDSHVGRLRAAMAAAQRLDRAETKAREAGRELAAARTAHKEALIAMTAPHSVRHEADS
jgi:hypothetical protein